MGRRASATPTRWSTPRRRLALIHNGIIENFLPLKKRLIAEGWTFSSDTDTEVVANLISSYLDRPDLRDAVARAVTELEGMYAFAVVTHRRREGPGDRGRPPGAAARHRPRRRASSSWPPTRRPSSSTPRT